MSENSKYTIYVVGMGPGTPDMMTPQAKNALAAADVIVGYTVYLDLLMELFGDKPLLSTPMRKETERCQLCFDIAENGFAAARDRAKNHGAEWTEEKPVRSLAMVCSGDAGVYGMASLMYEIAKNYPAAELVIVPGITAALSGGAVLGAPLSNDFCTISLSDYLTPWERIEKRLLAAAEGDFSIALYNPSSHKRKDYLQRACDILLKVLPPERCC